MWDLLRAKENPDYTQHNILQEIKADPIISMIFTVNFWTIKKKPPKKTKGVEVKCKGCHRPKIYT